MFFGQQEETGSPGPLNGRVIQRHDSFTLITLLLKTGKQAVGICFLLEVNLSRISSILTLKSEVFKETSQKTGAPCSFILMLPLRFYPRLFFRLNFCSPSLSPVSYRSSYYCCGRTMLRFFFYLYSAGVLDRQEWIQLWKMDKRFKCDLGATKRSCYSWKTANLDYNNSLGRQKMFT